MKLSYFPGWMLLALIGVASTSLSNLVELGGKHPLEASAIAVVIGVIARNTLGLAKVFHAGISAAEKPLILGIVLMGASLDFSIFKTQGLPILTIIVLTMTISFVLIVALGKVFKLSPALSMLLAVGSTICGTSAIAVTAPLIRAREEETSYAVATIALWGLIAILVYPLIAQTLGTSELSFGVFAGTAIHSTPQVVGAGFIYSELSGQTATAVKLVRNCFMAPLSIIIAVWFNRTQSSETTIANLARAFPWFLFGYFLMAACNTWGLISAPLASMCSESAKFLILISMAGIGLNTSLASFRHVGTKPLLVGCLGALVVACSSICFISLLLP